MKVTVCFGGTRVVVPCGSGHLLIRDLTEAAILRYKKATGKPNDSWVTVHSLKSISDGGILDPDDQLLAVVDDKEQILAIYEEQDSSPPPIPYSAGEGTSSLGTSSPEWGPEILRSSGRQSGGSSETGGFHRPPPVPHHAHDNSYAAKPALAVVDGPLMELTKNRRMGATMPGGAVANSVEITSLEDPPSHGLMVRGDSRNGDLNTILPGVANSFRGSIRIECSDSDGAFSTVSNRARNSGRSASYRKKRQAPKPPSQSNSGSSLNIESMKSNEEELTTEKVLPISPTLERVKTEGGGFVRASAPSKSIAGSFTRTGAPRQSTVGDKWLMAQEQAEERYIQNQNYEVSVDAESGDRVDKIEVEIGGLPGEPLGIQVSPDYGDNGRLNGVIVTQIHENGRVNDDGTLRLNDKITEINERPVYQMSFVRAQSYLHEISQQTPITFKVIRNVAQTDKIGEKHSDGAPGVGSALIPGKGPQSALQKANTKKLGQKMAVELKKGSQGLGFTVTSRDTAVEGERPFYIKTVLPRGAAIDDGRLLAGDRLLQVNDQEMTGMTQRAVVAFLRDFKQGDTVKLMISRHAETLSTTSSPTPAKNPSSGECSPVPPSRDAAASHVTPSPQLPRHLPPEKANAAELEEERSRQRQMMTLDVPLNATGSAGLGVSVKGRLVTKDNGAQEDCGIYIKGIIHGGAAQKDGRLRINDQLVGIEDAKLLGQSNKVAMQMIGHTMQNLSTNANSIRLTVLRVVTPPRQPGNYAHYHTTSSFTPNDPHPGAPPGSPDGGESMYLDIDRFQSALLMGTGPEHNRGRTMSDIQPSGSGSSNGAVPGPRYTIPGYGDYAVIVKGQNSVSGIGVKPVTETTMIIEDNGGGSYEAFPTPQKSNPLYEEVGSLSEKVDDDVFNREAPGRRSMSEKRHGGGKTDPSHTKTFQRIKEAKVAGNHQRQHSAPALQDVELVSGFDQSNKENEQVDQRRSLSLESLSRIPANGKVVGVQQPMIHELVSRNIPPRKEKKHGKIPYPLKKRHRPTNESFRQAVDRSYQSIPGAEVGVDVGGYSDDEEPAAQTQSLPRPAKDKERRKSTGSGLIMEWFGRQFGSSRSRENSVEKIKKVGSDKEGEALEIAKKAAEEEQRKIRVQYEKLKRQHEEMETRQMPSPKIPSRWRPPPSTQTSSGGQTGSKSTSHLPQQHGQHSQGYPGPPPPYQGLRRNYPPPPPPYRPEFDGGYPHGRSRAPTDLSYFDRMGPHMGIAMDYEDPNLHPAWFAVAAEHKKFYRSLDRPSHTGHVVPPGAECEGGPLPNPISTPSDPLVSTSQSRSDRDKMPPFLTPGGLHQGPSDAQNLIQGHQDQNKDTAPISKGAKRPPPPKTLLDLSPNVVNTDAKTFAANNLRQGGRITGANNTHRSSGILPNYDQYLRQTQNLGNYHGGRKQRPASNYYDYKSPNRILEGDVIKTVYGNPLYEIEPLPDYSPEEKNGFVMKM